MTRTNYGRGRFWSLGTGTVVAAIAMVMALAPMADAKVLAPPYKGQVDIFNYAVTDGCGTHAKVTHKAAWSLKTGWFTYGAAVSTHVCTGGLAKTANSQAQLEGGALVALPIAPGSGHHSVDVSWLASATDSGAITTGSGGVCPTTQGSFYVNSTYFENYTSGFCEVYAQTFIEGYGQIYDATNNTYCPNTWCTQAGGVYGFFGAYNVTFAENYTDIFYGVQDFNYPGGPQSFSYNFSYVTPITSWSNAIGSSNTVYMNDTFVTGHHYYLLVNEYADASTYMQLMSKVSGKATLDLGTTAGNGIQVSSITIV